MSGHTHTHAHTQTCIPMFHTESILTNQLAFSCQGTWFKTQIVKINSVYVPLWLSCRHPKTCSTSHSSVIYKYDSSIPKGQCACDICRLVPPRCQ